MEKRESHGLGLALKLIKVSLESDSAISRTIRKDVIKKLRQKMQEVTYIDEEEIPELMQQVEQISEKEPDVAAEVKQLVKKFHPDLDLNS